VENNGMAVSFSLFIEVPVPSQECEQSSMCVIGIVYK
jgi:hypothetical protein